MKTKTVFQTDHLGIYLGPVQADVSPLEPDVWMIPARCVEQAPPVADEHQLPRWDGDRWTLINSYAGLTAYNIKTGAPLAIERHGELPSGYTLSAPGPNQVWENGAWKDDIPAVVEQLYDEKYKEVNGACERAIIGGFWAQALGERHFYASALEDQLNLVGVITRALPAPVACVDEQGQREFREHTLEQLTQVSNTFCEYRLEAQQHADQLKKALAAARAAEDIKALEALSWGAKLA